MPITLLSEPGSCSEFMDTPRLSDDEIAAANRELDGRSPREILTWAVRHFHPKLMMATAFGPEGCCILHMLAEIEPRSKSSTWIRATSSPRLWNLRERILDRYGIEVELVRPELTVAEYENEHGGPLYVHRPDQCCFDRKVLPLRRAVKGYRPGSAPFAAIRPNTAAPPALCNGTPKFSVVKVNPLLALEQEGRVEFHFADNEVPYNPLHDQGYPSVGCWPCTAPVEDGGDDRSGRWAGSKKKECGLHVIEHQEGSGIW